MTHHDCHLCLKGVSKRHRTVEAVRDLDLCVPRGELLTVLGPSGCGKTTALRLIAGFERPDSGEIRIGDRLVAGPGVFVAPEHRRIGMVFQDYALFPNRTVAQNVGFGVPRRERADRVREMIALVGLGGMEHRRPHELSGGQQQRVALARALAPQPEAILLDEPLSSQDSETRARVRDDLRAILDRTGITAIHVTHDQEEALSLGDSVALMWEGRIAQRGAPETIYAEPSSPALAAFLGEANLVPGQVEASGCCAQSELGRVRLTTPAEAGQPVRMMIRPEWLSLHSAGVSDATEGTIISRTFYGHDQIVLVELASGLRLRVRTLTHPAANDGDRVFVRLERDALPYA